jgi:hypothetical protein
VDLETLFAHAGAVLPDRNATYAVDGLCLGLPVRIECTAESVAAVALAVLEPAQATTEPIVTLALESASEIFAAPELPLRHRDSADIRLFAGAGTAGRVDFAARRAMARLDPRLHERPVLLRDVLLAYMLSLLTRHDRTPVHAAAVGRGEAGVILAARSGTGKSTLAYACVAAGLRVLSDDAVFVQLDPSLHVYAPRGPLFLAPDAVRLFPQLALPTPQLRANGKRKIAVDNARDSAHFTRTALCLLQRTDATVPQLESMQPIEAIDQLHATLDAGFDVFASSMESVLHALAHEGAWRLNLSNDPHAAVPLIRSLIDRLTRP